jgi:hypothetical protein
MCDEMTLSWYDGKHEACDNNSCGTRQSGNRQSGKPGDQTIRQSGCETAIRQSGNQAIRHATASTKLATASKPSGKLGNQAIRQTGTEGAAPDNNQAQLILACSTHANSLHANQRDSNSLQVRGLTSHGVAKPMHACENPQHADYMLWQTASESKAGSDDAHSLSDDSISNEAISRMTLLFGEPLLPGIGNVLQRSRQFPDAVNAPEKARPISADRSDSNGRYEADSDLDPRRSLWAERKILGIENQPGQPGYFSDVKILQARPGFHRRAAEQISDLDSVSDLNPECSLLAEWKRLGFDIEQKPPGYWKQKILQALSNWNAVEQISGVAADSDSDSPGDCEPSVSLSHVGVSIQVDGKPPATSACCAQMVLQAQHDGNAAAQISDVAADLISVSDSDYSACMTEVEIQESQPVTDQYRQCSAVQPGSDQCNGQCWDQSEDHCDGEYAEHISDWDDPFRLPPFEYESAEQWESDELQKGIKPSGSQVHSSVQSTEYSFSDSNSNGSDEADSDFDDRQLNDEVSLEHSGEAGGTDCRPSGDTYGFSDAQGLGAEDHENCIHDSDNQDVGRRYCEQFHETQLVTEHHDSDQCSNQCNDQHSGQCTDQYSGQYCGQTIDQQNDIDQCDSTSQCSDQLNNQCSDELSDRYGDQYSDQYSLSDQYGGQLSDY